MNAGVGTVEFIVSASALKLPGLTLVDVHGSQGYLAVCEEVLSDPSRGERHVAQVPVKVTSTPT